MHNDYEKIFQASLLVAISAILYGFLGCLGTGILRENMSIATMLFWRFIIAGGWMFLFIIRKNSSQKIFDFINTRALFSMFLLGAIGYAGSSEFYFLASQYTGTGLAMVIFFSYPIIVALSGWIIQKKPLTAWTILSLVAMIIGLMLLRDTSTRQFNLIGIFFGLMAAICYAFYVIGSKKHISAFTMN